MKNQIKKSLSLFLAVLMIMSCWVWVAPEKAEAGIDAADKYRITIGYTVSEACTKSGANFRIRIYTLANNGTSSTEVCEIANHYDYQVTSTGDKTFTVETEGFPIYFGAAVSNGSSTGDNLTVVFNKVLIGSASSDSKDILNGVNQYTFERGSSASGYGDDKSFVLSGYNGETDDSKTEITYDKPYIAGWNTSSSSPSTLTTTLNKVGGVDKEMSAPTYTTSDYFDQYGVKWTASSNTFGTATEDITYVSKTATGTDAGLDDIYYDSTKNAVVAKANLQVSQQSSSGSWGGYLVRKVTYTNIGGGNFYSYNSTPITVTYPKYTYTFNGAGSVTATGLGHSMIMNQGSAQTTTYSASGYYGSSLSTYPTGDITTTGAYKFYKLWTKPQPTTGNASYNAYEADFVEPISNEKFEEYKTDGGTVNGDYITYNGKTYYNAGTQWDTVNKTFYSDANYYGWWLAEDITVKFYDIDGTFLGATSVKYDQKHSDITWPEPTPTYTSGAYEYSNFSGIWENIDGTEVDQTAYTFTKDLILTPKYNISFTNEYTVAFKDTDGNNITVIGDATDSNGNYKANTFLYRSDLIELNKIPADRTVPAAIASDKQYSYEFEGWAASTAEQPLTPINGLYHIVLENSDFDTNGTAIHIKDENSDWIVRNDVTYYPVFRRYIRTYAVNFKYKDSTGTDTTREVNVVYGEQIKAPTDYIPYTYATQGFEYSFANWQYRNGSNTLVQADYDASVLFNQDNFSLTLDAVADGDNVKPVEVTAVYGNPVAKPYNVTFKFKNADGEDDARVFEVKHGTEIGDDIISALAPATEYDNGEALVSYKGTWAVLDGAADKTQYDISELAAFSPTSHITFEAVYGDPKNFYTITYIDGANTFSERVLVGSDLPAWTIEETDDNGTPDNPDDDTKSDVPYEPTMAETAQGYYVFQGWFDEKQADTTYTVTNGTKYDAVNEVIEVTGNLTLYPQFKFEPFTYTIKFMDYTGTVELAKGEYQYGHSIAATVEEAVAAAQGRAQDETYKYTFIGWDKEVPEFCEGSDMTFVAVYKESYIYYQAKWYNSVLVDADNNIWAPDTSTDADGKETALLATTKHIYNTKLSSPSVAAVCPVASGDANKVYVFAGWKYNDAQGNAHDYVRGMKITSEMTLYATYELTSKAYTVTTVVPGEDNVTYKVAAGSVATKIPDPVDGYIDSDYHNQFDGWYTTADFAEGTEFDIENTVIDSDITIYAKLTKSAHIYDHSEVATKPTYYAKGELKKWCACDSTNAVQTEEIAMLTDTVKPTGTVYLGTQGKWSSTDAVGAAATDNDEVIYYANAETDLILTINDTGDVGTYNPSGVGKGIKKISGFISEGVYSQDNQNVNTSEVITIFEDDSETQNNAENYVIKLGQYGTLEHGKTYVAYYYAIDKAGNVLNEKVRTAKFIYDTEAPVITIEGSSNEAKTTYCEATLTGIEDGVTLTINGTVIDAAAIVDGKYAITTAGYHMITLADQAGNKSYRKINVIAGHDYIEKEILSTCTEDGYKQSECSVCGVKTEKVVYTAPGHVWAYTAVSATCEEKGYNLKTCELCGEEEKTYTYTDENGDEVDIYPAHGHIYDKDENGEIIYTVVTEATCRTKGKEAAICNACGERVERDIDIVEDITAQNHNFGSVRTLKATCTTAGKEYQVCGLCGYQKIVNELPATGHVETQWVVTTAATCGEAGEETLQCKKCKAFVDGDDADTVADTREISATGRHIIAVNTDPDKTFDATTEAEGQITRYCIECGQEWIEKVDKIVTYTVTFVDEDGTVLATFNRIADVDIQATEVETPSKANSADGKYKYTFASWKDEDSKTVTLPYTVTGDTTLTATYTQANIIYTHQFMVPNTWTSTLASEAPTYTEFASMMGAMGDARKPVAEPTFKLVDEEADAELKKLYTFEFKGWRNVETGEMEEDFIIAGDATFVAVFEAVPVAYRVIYYNGTEYVWDTIVDGGEKVTFGGTLPTKAYDSDKHYAFENWYTDATLKTPFDPDTVIKADIRLYAGFTSHDHEWALDADNETIPADCTTPETKFEKCYADNCGATRIVYPNPALGHTTENGRTENVQDAETGEWFSVTYCGRCGDEMSRTKTSVTVTFRNYNNVRVGTLNLNKDEQIVFDTIPTRPDDGEYTYTFAGWYVEGDETETVVTFGLATEDVTYIAKYTQAKLTFRVTYVDVNNETLYTVPGIEHGSAIPEFPESIAEPTKDYDDEFHYTFTGWSVDADAKVTNDLVISPVFAKEAHDYVKQAGSSNATCTKPGGGDDYKCSKCDSSYTEKATIPALGHKLVETRDAYDYIGGKTYVHYTCTRTGCTDVIESELLKNVEFTSDININGAPVIDGTVVELYKDGITVAAKAAINGQVTFYIYESGTYEVRYAGEVLASATANGNLELNTTTQTPVQPSEPDDSCSCTCHEDNFWGILFRLFHKLIKIFKGKIVCCSCPDSRY